MMEIPFGIQNPAYRPAVFFLPFIQILKQIVKIIIMNLIYIKY